MFHISLPWLHVCYTGMVLGLQYILPIENHNTDNFASPQVYTGNFARPKTCTGYMYRQFCQSQMFISMYSQFGPCQKNHVLTILTVVNPFIGNFACLKPVNWQFSSLICMNTECLDVLFGVGFVEKKLYGHTKVNSFFSGVPFA